MWRISWFWTLILLACCARSRWRHQGGIADRRLFEQSLEWSVLLSPTTPFRQMLLAGIGVAIAQRAVEIDDLGSYLVDVLVWSWKWKLAIAQMVCLELVRLGVRFVSGHLCDTRDPHPFPFHRWLLAMGSACKSSVKNTDLTCFQYHLRSGLSP